ncbi:hypothetical protein PsYK624_091870 [Phanerochaete sordida]|uniref:Uncharacterized protein n=1 Tax=Phanerochaete sordida TaxID=48140 RepID=A0A9P3LFT5_9APHY|nr:hypothetical protein PsYK624_091870 [Phanerochaete sordida]
MSSTPSSLCTYTSTGVLARLPADPSPSQCSGHAVVQQLPFPALFVTQRPYIATKSEKRFRGQQPINFELSPGVGVHLSYYLSNPTSLPEEWSTEPGVPLCSGQKVQIRINWPDRPDFVRSINVWNFAKNRQPISKIKLLKRVAEVVQKMVKVNGIIAGSEYDSWRIGEGGLRFENIALHSLENVSKGSWQPVLSLWY